MSQNGSKIFCFLLRNFVSHVDILTIYFLEKNDTSYRGIIWVIINQKMLERFFFFRYYDIFKFLLKILVGYVRLNLLYRYFLHITKEKNCLIESNIFMEIIFASFRRFDYFFHFH